MNFIERNKSFTIESFEERSAALASFLADNPLSKSYVLLCGPLGKIYQVIFPHKKYWIAHYVIELIRFKTGVILNDISCEFLFEFCNTSTKLTPYKKARSIALRQLKY